MVGVAGFEPTTPTPPVWCATRLRYTPRPLPRACNSRQLEGQTARNVNNDIILKKGDDPGQAIARNRHQWEATHH
jgi:hypothetical protein